MIQNEDQKRIRLYLLGKLADGEKEQIEQELLANDDLFEEILIVEEELSDEYVAGKLSGEERADFERHFLATPERQQNLRFAQALNRYVTAEANREPNSAYAAPPSWTKSWVGRVGRIATVVAVIAVAVAALWFFISTWQTPRTFAAITLTVSPNTRDQGVQSARVSLPLNADALRISLRLPNPSPPAIRYRAELLGDNGGSRSLEPAAQDRESVVLEISSAELSRGRYAVNLFAIQADGTAQRINGSYYFTVE
jgi:methionine-rich copper-binding protein CopC